MLPFQQGPDLAGHDLGEGLGHQHRVVPAYQPTALNAVHNCRQRTESKDVSVFGFLLTSTAYAIIVLIKIKQHQ